MQGVVGGGGLKPPTTRLCHFYNLINTRLRAPYGQLKCKGLARPRWALRDDPITSLITHLFHVDGVDKLVIVFVCFLLRVKEIDNDCDTVIKSLP